MNVRIGIDARKLHDFGIGTYIRNLLRQLARLDHETEFVLLCRPDDCGGAGGARREFPRRWPKRPATTRSPSSCRIPLALRREGVTLFHAPHYVLPPLVPLPLGRDDSRLHPPDVSAVPAEPPRARLRARRRSRWRRGARRGS